MHLGDTTICLFEFDVDVIVLIFTSDVPLVMTLCGTVWFLLSCLAIHWHAIFLSSLYLCSFSSYLPSFSSSFSFSFSLLRLITAHTYLHADENNHTLQPTCGIHIHATAQLHNCTIHSYTQVERGQLI